MEIKKQKRSIKHGDMFALGEHRLLCGDAQDKDSVHKLVGKDFISLILTDPPYGVDYVESKANFKQNISNDTSILNDDIMDDDAYDWFSRCWIMPVRPFLNKKNSIYIFNADKMLFALRYAMMCCDINFSQLLIWVKNNAVVGRLDYNPQHELIVYGWCGKHGFHKPKDKSVFFYPKPRQSKLHPTMKPVPLLRRLILNSSKVGDVVYDGFGGSGSTLIAAEHTKRKCLMMEVYPVHCETIIARWEKLTGKKAKKINEV